MANEIELKLSLLPADIEALRADSNFQALVESGSRSNLLNTYFDSPQLDLHKAKAAIRIRKSGDQFIQTLKTKGESLGGLHQRGEWEWTLKSDAGTLPALDLQKLAQVEIDLPADLSALQPVFTTHFDRETFVVQYNGSEIEWVLDRGEISAHQKLLPLCETELELKQGDPAQLFNFALKIARAYPAYSSDVSKGERGYQLFMDQAAQKKELLAPADYEVNNEAFIEKLQQQLKQFSRVAVGLQLETDGADVGQLQNCAEWLAELLEYGREQGLCEGLDTPLHDLAALVHRLRGYNAHEQEHFFNAFDPVIARLPGLISLAVGAWLYNYQAS